MTNLGIGAVVLVGLALLAVVVQSIRVWVKELVERAEQARLCEKRACAYYTDYLKKGPALLSHSQYHESVNAFRYWTTARDQWEWADGRGGAPTYTGRMIQNYRIQARL